MRDFPVSVCDEFHQKIEMGFGIIEFKAINKRSATISKIGSIY